MPMLLCVGMQDASLDVMLQICSSQVIKQLQVNVGLLSLSLQETRARMEPAANIELVLALSRGMEVLSRMSELLDSVHQ